MKNKTKPNTTEHSALYKTAPNSTKTIYVLNILRMLYDCTALAVQNHLSRALNSP